MVLHYRCHQNLSSSKNWGDIYPKSQPCGPGSASGHSATSFQRFLQTTSTLLGVRSLARVMSTIPLAFLLSLMTPFQDSRAQAVDSDQPAPGNLKQLSLEQLGNIEVTTVSKKPEKIQRTAAAIYVLTRRISAGPAPPASLRSFAWCPG